MPIQGSLLRLTLIYAIGVYVTYSYVYIIYTCVYIVHCICTPQYARSILPLTLCTYLVNSTMWICEGPLIGYDI